MPDRILKNNALLICAIYFLVYIVLARTLPHALLVEGVNGLRLTVSIVVALEFAPTAWESAKDRSTISRNNFGIGMFLIAWSQGVTSVWTAAGRIFEYETMLARSPTTAFLVATGVLGGILVITAPGIERGKVPKLNWWMLASAIAAGLIMAVLVVLNTWWRVNHGI